ncbi:hypothetical protein DE146DRAFT_755402 [Phaeosphaeria sp. MPI-PUGE-AT-0046c]|nr:hypothetical protein DE146DRAFT_755402 [Phaeosphaeria sp. MPI-PUGE-AT-0046c]
MGSSYNVLRPWGWEIMSVILANGLNVAIAVLLASYDGQLVPDWGDHLNLNAVLALLSTILRAMLVVVVAQIICQQKWEWYGTKRERPLRDLDRFDSGSRGSMGALFLMPTVLFKDAVTSVAAFVLLASFLIGPFVQQASRTTNCEFSRPNANASIPYAHYVPRRGGFNPFYSYSTATPTADTSVAILSSITAPNGTENQVVGSCTTGRCTFTNGDPIDPASPGRAGEDFSTHSTVGMCNKCIDISSLVSTRATNYSKETEYMLPTGLNVSYGGPPGEFAAIQPAKNLTWMGDLLTPELRAMSRWAYVNATFLGNREVNGTAKAAACFLYPCLRTYTASIENNSLTETFIRSDVMQIDLATSHSGPIAMRSYSALGNVFEHYAAVKSPCRAKNGRVYDVSQNMSTGPDATKLSLYDFSDPKQITFKNITAPEQCIYRQNSQFVAAIAKVLDENVFSGSCYSSKMGPECSKDVKAGRLANMATENVLTTLIQGNMSFANTTNLFDSFANAMTNRFRFEYGAATFNETNRNLPLGEIQGVAWQDSTCVQMQVKWLLLPICLTVFTTVLMMWTVGANWMHRHIRPVWKGSLFPLVFYAHKLDSKHGESGRGHGEAGIMARDGKLMEVAEMNEISKRTPLSFDWLDKNGGVIDASSPGYVQKETNWVKRRGQGMQDGASLLGGVPK